MVKELSKKSKNFSTDHLLIANPSQFEKLFPKHRLDSIPRELVKKMFEEKSKSDQSATFGLEGDIF